MSDSKDASPKSNPSESEDEMEPEPVACEVDPSELRKITVKIVGGRKKNYSRSFDVSEIKPVRRRDEGSRPIFDRPEIKEFYKKLRDKKKLKSEAKSAASCIESEKKKFSEELTRTIENPKRASDENLKKTKRYSSSPEKRRDEYRGKSRDRRECRSPVKKEEKPDDELKKKRYSPSPEKRRGEWRGKSRERRECRSPVRRGGRSRERKDTRDERLKKPSEEKHRYSPDKFRHRRSHSRDKRSRSRDRRSRSRSKRSRSRDKRSRSREKKNMSVELSQDDKDKKKQLPPDNCDTDYYEDDGSLYNGANPGMSRGWRHPVRPMGRVRMPIHPRPPPFPPYPPMGPVVIYPQAMYPPYPAPPRMRGFMPR